MMTLKTWRQMVLVAMTSLGVSASLRSEPIVTSAMPAEETHQQATPSAQPTNSMLPVQIEIAANSQSKSLSSTNEQGEAKAPQVSYEDGQLTIIAENASLSAVL